MIHHSNPMCDDCGERHNGGALCECVEALKEQIAVAARDARDDERERHEGRICEAIQSDLDMRELSCEPSDAYVAQGLRLALECIDQLPRVEDE